MVVDEAWWGLSWKIVEVELIPLSSFMSCSLHFYLDFVALALGDTSLKASIGVPWDAIDEAFLLWEFLAQDGESVM